MTFRLKSLAILPTPGGLEFPEAKFGRFLTHLHGDNGSGKTAVMCALYWVLGGARTVEEPLWSRCTGARLTLLTSDRREVTLFRAFTERFVANLTVGDAQPEHFSDEGEWSQAVLPLLGIEPREWSGKNGGVAAAYLSVVLPAFAIDQDKGWILPYSPFSNRQFIEDQSQEVTRLMLGIAQLHDPKRDAQRKKLTDELARLEGAIGIRSRAIESLAKSLPPQSSTLETMKASRENLATELRQFDSVVTSLAEIDAALQARVEAASGARNAAADELAMAKHRRAVLQKLLDEGKADLDLIGTNEVAADAFRRFCGNPSCQFFAGSAEPNSYGRRVLYLRDQFKDIVAAMDSVDGILRSTADKLALAESHLAQVRREYEVATKAKATDRVIAAVDSVTKELANVSRSIALSEEVGSERAARDELVDKRNGVHNDLANHDDADTRRRKSVSTAVAALRKSIVRWMEVLKTNEVGAIGVDDDLRLTVGGKVMSDSKGPSGSSRLRVILAYHAALLETSFELGGNHPPMLLFDAPKQHELDPKDFAAYLSELRKVFRDKNVQVVLTSRTEVPTEQEDAVWKPRFPGVEHPWYLGPASKVA